MKVVRLIFVLLFAAVSVWLAISNRHLVALNFDPFSGTETTLAIQLPLFLILFLAVAVGLIVGSVTTWFAQGRHRHLARVEKKQIKALEKELDSAREAVAVEEAPA